MYDHDSDPNEWSSVARDTRFAEIVDRHREWLPRANAQQVPDLRKASEVSD